MGAFVECLGGPLDGDAMYAYQAVEIQGARWHPRQPLTCWVRRCQRSLPNGEIIPVVLAGEPEAEVTGTQPRHRYVLLNGAFCHVEIQPGPAIAAADDGDDCA